MLFLHPYEYEMLEYLHTRDVPEWVDREGPQAVDDWIAGGQYVAVIGRHARKPVLARWWHALRQPWRGH